MGVGTSIFRVMFDKIAEKVNNFVSGAYFFAFCLALVVIWIIFLPFAGWANQIYHLMLNSPTTAITFILVPLMLNSQARNEKAMNYKLNAIADALADFMEVHPELDDRHARELRKAVGCEKVE